MRRRAADALSSSTIAALRYVRGDVAEARALVARDAARRAFATATTRGDLSSASPHQISSSSSSSSRRRASAFASSRGFAAGADGAAGGGGGGAGGGGEGGGSGPRWGGGGGGGGDKPQRQQPSSLQAKIDARRASRDADAATPGGGGRGGGGGVRGGGKQRQSRDGERGGGSSRGGGGSSRGGGGSRRVQQQQEKVPRLTHTSEWSASFDSVPKPYAAGMDATDLWPKQRIVHSTTPVKGALRSVRAQLLVNGRDRRSSRVSKPLLPKAVVYVSSVLNNTFVTLTTLAGRPLAWMSGGSQGFKGSRRTTSHAAQVTGERMGAKAKEMRCNRVIVAVKGPGYGKKAAVRGLKIAGLKILTIQDVSSYPHNGCRPRKKRRV